MKTNEPRFSPSHPTERDLLMDEIHRHVVRLKAIYEGIARKALLASLNWAESEGTDNEPHALEWWKHRAREASAAQAEWFEAVARYDSIEPDLD